MKTYRSLTAKEIEVLERHGNRSSEWDKVVVCDPIDSAKIWHSSFEGAVKIGRGTVVKESELVDCTVGDNCEVSHVRLMRGYEIGDGCVLFNIGEMVAQEAGYMPRVAPMNENGGREIGVVRGLTVGEAFLWAKYRGDKTFVGQMEHLAKQEAIAKPIGHIGDSAELRNCLAITNVTIESSAEEPTKVSNVVTLADGIVGYGCEVRNGVIAQRFMIGEKVRLLDGLRLTDSVVGDNSTLAGAEVTASMVFPFHEQHHSSSFLIAAAVEGQSNVAAGCVIGSNHNSRAADGELVAGRGFWPALCTSLKHSSRFASYCLLVKGDYPHELNIALPFALVSNNAGKNQLEVMPAYWWMYNMFALRRNAKKFEQRDSRTFKRQHIETSPLAPDTAEEIVNARKLLKYWTEQAYNPALMKLLPPEERKVEIVGQGMENSTRKVLILKAGKAYKAYEDMLVYYAMGLLREKYGQVPPEELSEGERDKQWVNIGGQPVRKEDLQRLQEDIVKVETLEDLQKWLDDRWEEYEDQKVRHAYKILCDLLLVDTIGAEQWGKLTERYEGLQRTVEQQRFLTRDKDMQNPFKQMTFDSIEEMEAVIGVALKTENNR